MLLREVQLREVKPSLHPCLTHPTFARCEGPAPHLDPAQCWSRLARCMLHCSAACLLHSVTVEPLGPPCPTSAAATWPNAWCPAPLLAWLHSDCTGRAAHLVPAQAHRLLATPSGQGWPPPLAGGARPGLHHATGALLVWHCVQDDCPVLPSLAGERLVVHQPAGARCTEPTGMQWCSSAWSPCCEVPC